MKEESSLRTGFTCLLPYSVAQHHQVVGATTTELSVRRDVLPVEEGTAPARVCRVKRSVASSLGGVMTGRMWKKDRYC